jgi:murein DD-endopeptidase MepM/ murein hydrolase activator NlpD
MFPGFDHLPHCGVNLEDEAIRWSAAHPEFASDPNPLLDPAVCQRMVDELHRRLGVAWSHGGYLENRRRLWRGSYLEARGTFLHLGVDLNVPQGTGVAASFPARVFLVDHDPDRDGGWGTRVFLASEGLIFIYAHLQNPSVGPGRALAPGDVFAEVGGPPENGNWMPHLHVQAIRSGLFHEILLERFGEIDGYGHPDDREELAHDFPDPGPWLGLES